MLKEAPYRFKQKSDIALFHQLRLELQIIFLDLCKYCEKRGMPAPTITSTIRGRLARSVSDTHAEDRAIDIRSWVYNLDEIDDMVDYINGEWADKYGTAPAGQLPRCLVYEGNLGKNNHLHLQVRR